MKAPQTRRLEDPDAEAVRRSHHDSIRELQTMPAAALRVLAGIELADGVATTIPHGLGRAPLWNAPSTIRGAVTSGRIDELRKDNDRATAIVLMANGYGATITIDLAVL